MGGVESGEFLWLLLSSVRGQTRWWEFAGAILCRMSAEERHPVEVEGGVRRAECRAGMG